MSHEDAKRFIDQIDEDPKLQHRLHAAAANFVAVGEEHGYHFTQSELHEELRKRWGVKKPADDPDTYTVTIG